MFHIYIVTAYIDSMNLHIKCLKNISNLSEKAIDHVKLHKIHDF